MKNEVKQLFFVILHACIGLAIYTTQLHAHNDITLQHSTYHNHPIAPHIVDGRFFTHAYENRVKHEIINACAIFWKTITSWQPYFNSDPSAWIKHDKPVEQSTQLRIQWIGHASFLIQVNNFNILTDPIFYDLNTFLYPRKTPVGIQPEDLPPIDFVIISHNHRDHTDEPSLKFLVNQQPIVLVPQGTQNYFEKLGFQTVYEHQWWQADNFSRDEHTIEFTFVPAAHWSGRTAFDIHRSLWGGWIIKSASKTVYFAGDTAFDRFIFEAIALYAPSIDYALLPIGPCEPHDYVHSSHMNAAQAVDAFQLLNARVCIPMHWGTFRLGPDSFDTPIKILDASWEQKNISHHCLHKIKFGEAVVDA